MLRRLLRLFRPERPRRKLPLSAFYHPTSRLSPQQAAELEAMMQDRLAGPPAPPRPQRRRRGQYAYRVEPVFPEDAVAAGLVSWSDYVDDVKRDARRSLRRGRS